MIIIPMTIGIVMRIIQVTVIARILVAATTITILLVVIMVVIPMTIHDSNQAILAIMITMVMIPE